MLMVERLVDWPIRLNAFITASRELKWGYGEHDCCTFTAGAVKAITGVDYMEEFRGKYDDEETSNDALKEIGQGDLYRTLVDKFGKAIPVAAAHRGDIVLLDGCLGVVLGKLSMFIKAEGYGFAPTLSCQRAFKVARL